MDPSPHPTGSDCKPSIVKHTEYINKDREFKVNQVYKKTDKDRDGERDVRPVSVSTLNLMNIKHPHPNLFFFFDCSFLTISLMLSYTRPFMCAGLFYTSAESKVLLSQTFSSFV